MMGRTLLCPQTADYSQVPGNVILPFVFALDLAQSNGRITLPGTWL